MTVEERNADSNLTLAQQRSVEQHVKSTIQPWLKWLGLGNLAAIIGFFGYVVLVIPEYATQRVVEGVDQKVANLTTQLENKLADVYVLTGKVTQSYSKLEEDIIQLNQAATKYAADVQNLSESQIAGVTSLITSLSGSSNIQELLSEIDALQEQIRRLGIVREGPTTTINNPIIGGPDIAECPPGYFVSKVHASGAVGGKYAVDGISALRVTCSPLVFESS